MYRPPRGEADPRRALAGNADGPGPAPADHAANQRRAAIGSTLQALQRALPRGRRSADARDQLRPVAAEPPPLQMVSPGGIQESGRRRGRDLGADGRRAWVDGARRADAAGRVLEADGALLR